MITRVQSNKFEKGKCSCPKQGATRKCREGRRRSESWQSRESGHPYRTSPTGLVLVFLQKQGRVNIKIKEEKICKQKTRSITLQKNSKWHKKMKGT